MYYVYEHQVRPDGIVNILDVVGRTTFELAAAYFYERCSKMSGNTDFVSVHISLVDEKLDVKKHEDVKTSYVAATE